MRWSIHVSYLSGDGLAPIDSFACSVGYDVDWVVGCWLGLGLVICDGV